jgi:hypothetical protein
VGIFSKKPNAGRIHATKAGRFLADIERENDRNRKQEQDELAARRAKNGGEK